MSVTGFLLYIIINQTLAVVVCLIIGLTHVKKRKTAQKNRNLTKAYHEKKMNEFIEDAKNYDGKSTDVVFLGDSLTDYCNLDNYYSGYSKVNRGIGGDTTTGVIERLKLSVYDFNPKVVVLLIGGNNIYTMKDDYEDIIENILSNCPKTKMVLVSLAPATREFSYINQYEDDRNKFISRLAKHYGFEYVDINTPLKDTVTGKLRDEYTCDGIHFSHEGYLVVTPLIDKAIKKLLS